MFTRIKNQQPYESVTIEEVKDQLNLIGFDDDDIHLEMLINVAYERAEGITKRLLTTGTVELITNQKCMFLPYGEVETVTSVEVAGNPVEFSFEPISQILNITDGTVVDGITEVKVTYDAGYDVDSLPHCAKMAILMIVSTLYEHREDEVETSLVRSPIASIDLLSRIKIEGF